MHKHFLCLTVYDFMVYKDYKIEIKFDFITNTTISRTQDFACPLVYHYFHCCVFLQTILSQLSHCILHKLLIVFSLINYLLLPSFTYSTAISEDDIFTFVLCLNDAFFQTLILLSYSFHRVYLTLLLPVTTFPCSFFFFCKP